MAWIDSHRYFLLPKLFWKQTDEVQNYINIIVYRWILDNNTEMSKTIFNIIIICILNSIL